MQVLNYIFKLHHYRKKINVNLNACSHYFYTLKWNVTHSQPHNRLWLKHFVNEVILRLRHVFATLYANERHCWMNKILLCARYNKTQHHLFQSRNTPRMHYDRLDMMTGEAISTWWKTTRVYDVCPRLSESLSSSAISHLLCMILPLLDAALFMAPHRSEPLAPFFLLVSEAGKMCPLPRHASL